MRCDFNVDPIIKKEEEDTKLKIRVLNRVGSKYLIKIYCIYTFRDKKGRPKEIPLASKFTESDFVVGNESYVSSVDSSLWYKGIYIIEVKSEHNVDFVLPKNAALTSQMVIFNI